MLKILILEDDIKQRENLFKLIIREYTNVYIYLAGTINESISIIQKEYLDLFFIDINLPDGNGIDFAKEIRKFSKYKLTGIIFITTESMKILDAFKEIHCYDFLVKPYEFEDIKNVIDVFNEKEYDNKEEDYIIVDMENGVSLKVYEQSIIFVEYFKRSCKIHTTKGVVESKHITLSKMVRDIKSINIIQAHKSYLVNTKYIERIDKVYNKLWEIKFFVTNNVAQMSNTYKENVYDKWGK